MDTREATLKDPTKTCRMEGCSSFKLTNAMTANTPKTATNNPVIFTCQQYLEKVRTRTKQINGPGKKKKAATNLRGETYLLRILSKGDEYCYVD